MFTNWGFYVDEELMGLSVYFSCVFMETLKRCWGLSSRNGMKVKLPAVRCLPLRSLLRCMLSVWLSLLLLLVLMDGW